MLSATRLQLASRRQNAGCCCNSSLNRNRQPAPRPAALRQGRVSQRVYVARSSQDPATSTPQAVQATPSGSAHQQPISTPAAIAQAQAEGPQKSNGLTDQQSQEPQQEACSPSSSSSSGPPGPSGVDPSSNASSTQGRNGSSTAADPAADSKGEEYILFTADELLQDVPAPDTSSTASAGDSSTTSSNTTSSSTSPESSTDSATSSSSIATGVVDTATQDSSKPAADAPQQVAKEEEQQQQEVQDVPQQQQVQDAAQQQQQAVAQQDAVGVQDPPPPLPGHLSLSIGPIEEAADEQDSPAAQEVFVPPPLIDPTVDIANDPAYAIRLMDILDQIASTTSSSSSVSISSSGQGAEVSDRVPLLLGCAPDTRLHPHPLHNPALS